MTWEQETAGRKGVCPIPGVCHMLVTDWMGSLRFGSEKLGEPFNRFVLDVIGRSQCKTDLSLLSDDFLHRWSCNWSGLFSHLWLGSTFWLLDTAGLGHSVCRYLFSFVVELLGWVSWQFTMTHVSVGMALPWEGAHTPWKAEPDSAFGGQNGHTLFSYITSSAKTASSSLAMGAENALPISNEGNIA